jgi:ADP-heptose:LPS heptosyltransferase
MRILFIGANRVGDAVITCGILDYLIRHNPTCRITIVCGPVAEGIYARMPNLERIILMEKRKYDLHWLALWREVVTTWWDLVVDLRGSAMAFAVPTLRRRIRLRTPGRMFEQHAATLRIQETPLPVVWTAAEDRAKAAELLPPGRPYIGFGPTANWAPKVWPAERFVELYHAMAVDDLASAVPVVFGGPGTTEAAMAAPVLAALPNAINLVGRLELPEVAAAIQRCIVYIGNDSGLTHMAAAAEIPTVGLCATTLNRADEMVPAGLFADWARGTGERMEDLSVEVARDTARRLMAQRDAAGYAAAHHDG